MKSVTYKGIEYVQNDYNHHVAGIEGGEMVFHAQFDRELTEEELMNVAKFHADMKDEAFEYFLGKDYVDEDTKE